MTSQNHVCRRAVLTRLAAISLAIAPGGSLVAGCGMRGERERPDSDQDAPELLMDGDMMGPQMMADMRVIRDLLAGHDEIERKVEDIDGGVRTRTTSPDPELSELIRTHVTAMRSRMVENRPIRSMDPLFREIFAHHDAISIEISDIPGGVEVTETSPDPQVELLIRQHAHRAVSEFVASGMSRARQPTPLPDGYDG